MKHSQLFSNASIGASALTFLWGSLKSLSSRWLSNDLYLVWKEPRDRCNSSGYLLRGFWIPNLAAYHLHQRDTAKLEVFPISAGHWYQQPFDVISGWISPLPLVWFSTEALVQTLREWDISLPSSFEKWDSFNKANVFWQLCSACQISKTLIAPRRRFKMHLIHVSIRPVIFFFNASELARMGMTNGEQMLWTISWVHRDPTAAWWPVTSSRGHQHLSSCFQRGATSGDNLGDAKWQSWSQQLFGVTSANETCVWGSWVQMFDQETRSWKHLDGRLGYTEHKRTVR